MKFSNFLILFNVFFLLLLSSCGKDKNLEDYRGEQLQIAIARINAISGSYSGPVVSKIDGSSLGNLQLNFKASTDIQSNSGQVSNNQNATVTGSITLRSISTNEIPFENGIYNDSTKGIQINIPVSRDGRVIGKISLSGVVSGDSWVGNIEVNGQSQSGADLYLTKNAPPPNSSSLEIGGSRLEKIKKLNYKYAGSTNITGKDGEFKLIFLDNKDILPEQSLYKLFSPIRQINLNCDLGAFELNFQNAIINDNTGTIVGQDPTFMGKPISANLVCYQFVDSHDFGWDCEIETKSTIFRSRVKALK
jgi:hypothetical protein